LDPTDPTDALLDGDSDSMNNLFEFNHLSNPNLVDSDGDGVSDYDEIMVYFSAADLTDTDGDSLSDSLEIYTHGTSPVLADTDADGINDDVELANNLDPLDPADAYSDADGDHVTAVREIENNLDPNNPDTDNDGVNDGDDAFPLDDQQWQLMLDGVYKGAKSNSDNSAQ
jgi:hypothetical protein